MFLLQARLALAAQQQLSEAQAHVLQLRGMSREVEQQRQLQENLRSEMEEFVQVCRNVKSRTAQPMAAH